MPSEQRIFVIVAIPREAIRHTRAVQEWLAEGLQEVLQEGRCEERQLQAVNVTLS